MYFVADTEKRQCEINGITVKERGVYLLRFRADGDIKWAHARVDEIDESKIMLRTCAGMPAIAVPIDDVLEVHGGEAKVEEFGEDIMLSLIRGEIYSESTKSLLKGDR